MTISPISSMLNYSSIYTSSSLSDMTSIAKRYEEFKANSSDLKAQYAKLAKSWKTQEAAAKASRTDTALKSSADSLKTAADKLSSAVKVSEDGTYSVDSDKLLAAAKDFVSSYNSTKEAAAKSDNVNVLKKASFMIGSTSANEKLLEKVGITVNKDNSLSLNEETLKNADARFVKSVFGGENSYASRISQKASQFSTLAETPKSTYQTYSASGIEEWIASYTSGSSLNLLV